MKNLRNQKRIFMMGVIILVMGCASTTDSPKTVNQPVFIPSTPIPDTQSRAIAEEGWGANPKELNNAKNANGLISNWYTKKYSGKADERSIELKSPSYMETTCRLSIKKEKSKALIEAAFISVDSNIKPEMIAQLITEEDIKNIEVSDCKPTSQSNSFSECECLLSFKIEGGKKTIIDKISH